MRRGIAGDGSTASLLDDNRSISSGEEDDDKEPLSFGRTHFGTDMLVGSYFMLFSAVIFYAIMAYYVSIIHFLVTPPAVIYNYLCYLVTSIIYIVAAVLFVTISYPDAYDKFMSDVASADIQKLSFTEKYLTGNTLLIASWLIFIATLPIIVYPAWAMADGDLTYLTGIRLLIIYHPSIIYSLFLHPLFLSDVRTGSLYLITVFIILVFLVFFTIAVFPENLAKNNGQGSSMIYDSFCYCTCCDGICGREWLQCHFGNDLLASLWLLVVGAILCLALSVYYLVVNYDQVVSYMWLLSSLLFLVGSYYWVYTFYPENYGSTSFYDMITCSMSIRRRKPAFLEAYGVENSAEDEESCHFRDVGIDENTPTDHIIKKE